jgi:hypothetical protein
MQRRICVRAPLKIQILSFRRRPESSIFNQLDTGLRRCDELLEVPHREILVRPLGTLLPIAVIRFAPITVPFNPDSSLAIELSQNHWVVGRVLTRHVGLKPNLRSNGLFGFNLKTAVATPLMLRYTLLRKALSTNGVVTVLVGDRSP